MAFNWRRPDRALLVRVPFGDDWLALADPSETGRCDPYDVRSRLALYRLLVERGNAHGAFGPNDELCPWWGYASQLAWQHRSGRLGGDGHAIDRESWWGGCNYALSVIPYIAAMQLGLVPSLSLDGCGYDRAIGSWREALREASALRAGGDHDRVRVATWRAHVASIAIAVDRHDRDYRAMPEAERRFARGWVRMVDLFASAALRTDLQSLAEQGGWTLPSRVLSNAALDDLPPAERGAVRRIGSLADRPSWRWAVELRAWRRVMRTPAARAEAEVLLAAMLGRGPRAWRARARALTYALLPADLVPRSK